MAWAIHFKNGLGKPACKRLCVPARGLEKGFLETLETSEDKKKSEWAQARRATYLEALRFWNENDRSKRDRINVSEAPASSS
jgi:hypothetical protein